MELKICSQLRMEMLLSSSFSFLFTYHVFEKKNFYSVYYVYNYSKFFLLKYFILIQINFFEL